MFCDGLDKFLVVDGVFDIGHFQLVLKIQPNSMTILSVRSKACPREFDAANAGQQLASLFIFRSAVKVFGAVAKTIDESIKILACRKEDSDCIGELWSDIWLSFGKAGLPRVIFRLQ